VASARAASSDVTSGAPKTIIMPSPRNLFTTPP